MNNQIETEIHLGNEQPKDPWKFASNIDSSQTVTKYDANGTINVLFNKGRYFETSLPSRSLLVSLSKAIKSKIQYNCMIADSWKKLESFVKACNRRGYYVNLTIDWI